MKIRENITIKIPINIDRLFVSLKSIVFDWYCYNGKKYELRAEKGNFSRKFVYTGRKVEIRRGYSGNGNGMGRIGKVYTGSCLKKLLNNVPIKQVLPTVKNYEQARKLIRKFIGKPSNYILFEII